MWTAAKLLTANWRSNTNTPIYNCNFGDYRDVIFFQVSKFGAKWYKSNFLLLTCYKGQGTCVLKEKWASYILLTFSNYC